MNKDKIDILKKLFFSLVFTHSWERIVDEAQVHFFFTPLIFLNN